MKRLEHELASSDPATAAAARLAKAAASSQLPVGLAQRVRADVMAREHATPGWRLQPTLIAALLLGLVALAGATAARVWRDHHAAPAAAHETVSAVVTPIAKPPRARLAREAPAVVVEPPESPEPLPSAPAQLPHRSDEARPAPAVVAKPAPPDATPPPTEISSAAILVLDATRALHTDHDPARARTLLDDYLRRYPHGDLAEEALALSIEAATLQDDHAAGRLARAYLQRFPAGRFRAIARRAADRFAE